MFCDVIATSLSFHVEATLLQRDDVTRASRGDLVTSSKRERDVSTFVCLHLVAAAL